MAKKKKIVNQAKTKKKDISTTELAARLKVSRQRVLKAIESGIFEQSIKKIKQGTNIRYKFDEGKAIQEWANNIDPSKQRDQAKQADTKNLNEGATPSQYQKAKGVKEFYSAKLAQLDYEAKAGKLVPADQVKAEAFKMGRILRDTIMGVPERISPELANMTDPRQISIYIKEQLALALKDLGDLNNVGQPRA